MNPNVVRGLQLIIVYQYWFVSCNKCTTLCMMLTTGETVRREERGIWEFSEKIKVHRFVVLLVESIVLITEASGQLD